VTHYANTERESAGGYTAPWAKVGFDAELRSSGTCRLPERPVEDRRAAPLLTPRLAIAMCRRATRGRGSIPQIDRDVFSTYLPRSPGRDAQHR